MAKPKYRDYENAKQFVKNKDRAVNTYIDTMLNRTQAMFKYDNLPDTIPSEMLEHYLQVNGDCFIAEVNGNLYALTGATGGELDAYNRPTIYTVANSALQLSKNFKIDVDGVLVKNDFHAMGIMPVLAKYGALMCDAEISLNTATVLARITMLISACDDRTKQSAEQFITKILDGDISVIGETAFFEGVRLQTASQGTSGNFLTQLIEVIQYYRACGFNEIGLNANYNMKRESLNANEIALNIDSLIPLSTEMLKQRKTAMEKVNAMFGTEITVEFNSVWKTTVEQMEQATEIADTELAETEGEQETQETQETETPIETVETVEVPTEETIETVETIETIETVETSETEETPETIETDETPETIETVEETEETPLDEKGVEEDEETA